MFDPLLLGFFITGNLDPFLLIVWTISKSSNYDGMKMSWEMKSIHDNFLFQIVMVDDSS
jgi:hypothetical protein